MTIIREVLEKFKCSKCGDDTDIKKLELFTELDIETKKVKFFIYCEECKTAQGIEIHKPFKITDYLLDPRIGAG